MTNSAFKSAEEYNHHGAVLLAQGRIQDAIAAYRTAVAVNEAYPEAHYNLAGAFVKCEQWEAALMSYGRAVALRPDYAAAHINLGNVFMTMNRFEDAIAAFSNACALQPVFPEAFYNLGNACAYVERWDDAAESYRRAIAARPTYAEACNNLGHVLMKIGLSQEALPALQAAVHLRPQFVEAHNGLGKIFASLGRWEEAVASYRAVLCVRPNDAVIHNELGNALLAMGRFEEAGEAYGQAIAFHGAFAEAHYNQANVLVVLDKNIEAIAAYRRALALQPSRSEIYINLSVALIDLGRFAEAIDVCKYLVGLAPSVAASYHHLGSAYREAGQIEEAINAYRRSLALNADDAEVAFALANLLVATPDTREEAYALFRRAHGVKPLQKRSGVGKPEFSVVAFNAPGAANTPSDYILGGPNYDTYGALVLEGIDHDLDGLRTRADVIVNLVSDADLGRHVLPELGKLIDALDRPVINHPRAILETSRDIVASRLAHVTACRVPRTARVGGDAGHANFGEGVLAEFALPFLMRKCGAHGGDELEKVDTLEAAIVVLDRASDADFYLTEYISYESNDGYFRKYRLFCVGGEWFPYHLAIADQWKVHHFRTDMANQAWMRDEEEAFVKDYRAIFTYRHCLALEQIHRVMDLAFFGIDCSFDLNGDLLVFEVNATMLIHEEKGVFSYKQPAIACIKRAFDALLAEKAGKSR